MAILITDVELVSTDSFGGQGDGHSVLGSFSPDGTKFAFRSSASNLVAGDTNGNEDVFIKDLTTGVVTLAGTNSVGAQGNGGTVDIKFSPDGSKIIFRSNSSNLVAGDSNGWDDYFLKDLTTGTVTLVSTSSSGIQGNHGVDHGEFSPDGTKIIFSSLASSLVAEDTNGVTDVFIKDLATGTLSRISTDSVNGQINGGSGGAKFSPDGTKIVFGSNATNLVADDTNGIIDLFVKDLNTGIVTRVSTDNAGAQANGESALVGFSPDGTKIIFSSTASNLVAGDTNGTWDVFIKDLTTGFVTRISTDSTGAEGNGESDNGEFSPDGTKVAFHSYASNLVSGDTNGVRDVFIKDLVTGETVRISVNELGIQGDGDSLRPVFSPDGTKIKIDSYASNLVSGDTNGVLDMFMLTTNLPAGIYGTGLADVLNGTDANDIIYGFQGNDTINGLSGNDTLKGGDGDDYLLGYDPLETSIEDVNSNPGDTPQFEEVPTLGKNEVNYLYGSAGNDTLDNGAAGGELRGGDGSDVLRGYAHQDGMGGIGEPPSSTALMYGEEGNDTLLNGAFMDGGEGNDHIENEGRQSSRIYGGTGNDTVFAAGLIYGGEGNDDISGRVIVSVWDWDNPMDTTRYGSWIDAFGEGGNDHITSNTGFLDGGIGDDVLILTGSLNEGDPLEQSKIYGGDGHDWIEAYVNHGSDRLWGISHTQADFIDAGSGDDTVLVHTRANIDVGEGNDIIQLFSVYGPELGETSNAFTGETIAFGSGETTVGSWIDGGAGYDVVEMVDFRVFTVANFADGFGLTNVERLVGNTQDNIINLTWFSVGDINVQGLGGHDIIWSNIGNDTLEGGDGNDTIRGFAGNDTILGGEGNDFIGADDGNDTAFGDAGNDDIRGGYGEDFLYGGEGDDRLKGNEENDALYGDLGNDKLYGGIGDDLLSGGDGIDELYGEDGNDTLYGGLGNDKLSGAAGIDRLNGGDGVDKLYGGDGDDQLKGNEDNDTLYGEGGNDKLYGGTGDDILNGGDGIDELYGEDGNDKMFGGAGADKLSSGNGNDRLTGGEGSDNLWGGAGSDQFVFDAASLSARDTIKDFSIAQSDRLELNNILTGYDPLTSAIADFVKITESSGKSYLSVDANGATGGAFFIQIAQIDGATGMTNVDQLLNDHVLVVTNNAVV